MSNVIWLLWCMQNKNYNVIQETKLLKLDGLCILFSRNKHINILQTIFVLVGMSGSSCPSNTLIFLAMHKCVLQSGMCMVQGKPSQLVEQLCRFLVNMGKFTVFHYLGRGRWNGWFCRQESEKEAGFGPDGIIWSEFQTSTFPKFSWWFTCFYQFNIVNQLM